ncbi:hypothetical protein GCM10022243_46460 [Saccharothrix violaceirubra]|uniref:Uncharacterized protein n=1 Tax=Saccharothrix violaceirubra TaxID=413306 RepID=A0A7W7T1C1_9PSEU|nr:hypothetical protein [Saccharothrix violaceirubra]MBB4964466.1 hypothetical protein [Saccharothrix violaceirubra]
MTGLPAPIPGPDLVAAWRVFDLVPFDGVPRWAAHWIADGHDGAALTTLAGLSEQDTARVRELLPDAVAECGVPEPTRVEAAGAVFARLALDHVEGRLDRAEVTAWANLVMKLSDYDGEVLGLPLGVLFDFPDLHPYDGYPADRLAEIVREACRKQLDG